MSNDQYTQMYDKNWEEVLIGNNKGRIPEAAVAVGNILLHLKLASIFLVLVFFGGWGLMVDRGKDWNGFVHPILEKH